MSAYWLGIDIGTTSTKAVLFSEKGQVIAQENIGYPLYTPDISTAEQDPEEIFSAVVTAMSNIMNHHSDKKISFVAPGTLVVENAVQTLTFLHVLSWFFF